MRLRLGLAVLVSLLALPVLRPSLPVRFDPFEMLVPLLISELLIGFTFGLAGRFVLSALQMAGFIIAQQMGLSFAMSMDPVNGDQGQVAIITTFLSLLAITLIFATNLHHIVLMGIVDTYSSFKVGAYMSGTEGTGAFGGDALQLALTMAGAAFAVGIKLAAPFLVFGLVFNVGLGILSRMMPQLQVFFLAMPATILLGALLMIAVLPLMMEGYLAHLKTVFLELFPGGR